MENLLIILGGVAVGAYYAESIRKNVPILNPNSTTDAE